MLINADFSRRAAVAPAQYQWVRSPGGEVERVMLDRLGAEHARATSVVRYAAGASFPRHAHPGGEEVLVLSGAFCEGDQRYGAGWYLRNPPGSAHQPFSPEGAVIFVKLWQMAATEQRHVRIDTRDPANWHSAHGRAVCPLFSSELEQTSLQRLAPGARLFAAAVNGAELLVLEGSLDEAGDCHASGSWIRLPPGAAAPLRAGAHGATVYLKTGHLGDAAAGAPP